MLWLKRYRWKAYIAFVVLLLLWVLMVWVPISAGAHEGVLGIATPLTATVQATPTIDATMTALNKEKLAQEVQQLKDQNNPGFLSWIQTNSAILFSTLVIVIGGLIGLFRWFGDRRDAQDKELRAQAEERFKAAVTALGDENEATQVGGAILLRSFLKKEDKKIYGLYYIQIFDLAVAYLRLPNMSRPTEDPDGYSLPPKDLNTPVPFTPLRQALGTILKEVFPLARDRLKLPEELSTIYIPRSLDATRIKLDSVFLREADLRFVWMLQASLREVVLIEANLSNAVLSGANFSKAHLELTNFNNTSLARTNFSGADLHGASLRGAALHEADLTGANLAQADLHGVRLPKANLNSANLSGTNIEEALFMKDTDLRGVKGLTKEQLAACKAKGAIIDENSTVSSSQQSISHPPPTLSNDTQAPSATPAQANTPTPTTNGNSSASSQPEVES